MRRQTSSPDAAGLTTLAASFGFVVVQLDVTIVNVALPAMAACMEARSSRRAC